MTAEPTLTTIRPGVARISWPAELTSRGFLPAVEAVSAAVSAAMSEHVRVEAWVDPDDVPAQRVATWSGLHREGVLRGAEEHGGRHHDRILYARVTGDPPVSEPAGFRALLNSFLPRKRAIGQLLVRDQNDRVLLCQLTYKRDWDLPGGVVEVGESPRQAVSREVHEELGLTIAAGRLLLTDWLPAWGGWDDAVCLVFDGGVHDPAVAGEIVREEREIRHAAFVTLAEAQERVADFTARRLGAAMESARTGISGYTESGILP